MPTIKITGKVPKEIVRIDEVRLQLLNALRAEGRQIRRELQATTRTWNHKVKFQMKVSLRYVVGEGYVKVWTDDEIYAYVNDGTPPHVMGPIRPVRAKALRIPTGKVRPKTRPGSLRSYAGARPGPHVFATKTKLFTHPGTRPRDFTVLIRNRIYKTGRFQKRIDDAIAKGLVRAEGKSRKIT